MTRPDHLILAMDSALGSGSVAVAKAQRLLSCQLDTQKGMQARNLLPMIEYALKQAGISYEALGMIVSTVGPGSFTGIRIALASARAIGLVSGKPVYGIGTLACLAYDALPHTSAAHMLCLLPAGKGDCYAQRFRTQPFAPDGEAELVSAVQLCSLKQADEFWVSIKDRDIKGMEDKLDYGANMHAGIAAALATSESAVNFLLQPQPLYIRPPDITMPRQTVAAK